MIFVVTLVKSHFLNLVVGYTKRIFGVCWDNLRGDEKLALGYFGRELLFVT